MARRQEHLRAVAMETGFPPLMEEFDRLFEVGVMRIREREQAARAEERGGNDKRNPSVSDANKCERAVVYSLLNTPESNPPASDDILRMNEGHDFENTFADILDAAGVKYEREVRVEIEIDGSKVTGRIDFVVEPNEYLGNTVPAPVECKSTNGRALGFILKEGQPKADHVAQLNLYMYAKKFGFGYVLYGARGSTKGEPYKLPFLVPRNDSLATTHLADMERAVRLAAAGTVPPRPAGYTEGKYPCTSYCPYFKHCWEKE